MLNGGTIPIRILQFIPGYYIGGIESLVMSLYRSIDKSRVQFDFLVETQEWLQDFDEIIHYGGYVYQLKPLNKKKPLHYIKQIQSFFDKHSNTYSAVHCHNIERSLLVLYYAKKYNINCRIFHAHTDSAVDARYEKITKLLIRLNNKLSTHLFSCSESAGNFYFKKDKKSFIVLKNTIDTQSFSFSTEKQKTMRETMGLSKCFVVGHTGRFTYPKNHWKIIDTFNEIHQKLPNSRLLLVGEGPTRQEIEEKVNQLGLSEAVVFTGSRNDITDLLQCMDVFLLPSFFEGFCISLLEAQSVGLPCVTSNIIPPEVQVTDLITKLDVNENNTKWANTVLTYRSHDRKSQHQIIIKNGYDTKENAKWLMEFYLDQA